MEAYGNQGHGTGKLLQESADGKLNFDRALVNPLTGKPIESWYKPGAPLSLLSERGCRLTDHPPGIGETYGSRIGPVSSSMEECRAEAVALYRASELDCSS